MPVNSWKSLEIFYVFGNEVAKLVDDFKPAGKYEVEFSAKDGLASGIYYYQFRAGEFVQAKKMMILK